MPSLLGSLEASRLSRVAKDIEALAAPAVFLIPGEQSEDPCTRLGGRPNLPAEIDWPVWQGEALPFIAQLDLAAIPQIDGLPLPQNGSLFFFYEGGRRAFGLSPMDEGSVQVIYSPSHLAAHPSRTPPKHVPDEMQFTGITLELESGHVDLPSDEDQAVDRLMLSVEERESYSEFVTTWNRQEAPIHQIGGHPAPLQEDPKLTAQLVTSGFGRDSTGYQRAKELGFWAGATDWKLLLQIDSDEDTGMMWGDVGCLYFLIREEDLKREAFDKVWLIFQCC